MDAKQFTELLKSPLLVAQLPADALRELVSRYPYSATLQMLLLKYYQLTEHPAYDEQMGKAAIAAPNRRALYRLVQLKEAEPARILAEQPAWESSPAVEAPAYAEPEIAQDPIESAVEFVPTAEDTIEVTDTAPEPETYPNILADDTEPLPQQEVEEPIIEPLPEEESVEVASEAFTYGFLPPIIPAEHVTELRQKQAEPKETEVAAAAEPIGEEEAPTTAEAEMEAEIEESVKEEAELVEEEAAAIEPEPSTPVEEDTVEQEPEIEQETVKETKPELETESEPDTFDAPATIVQQKPAAHRTDSFMGWLQRVKRHELPTDLENEETPAVDEKAALDALFGAGTYEATLIKASVDMPPVPLKQQAKPTKEELMEPDEEANKRMDELAKKSLTMGEELVTETLARIYEIQKKTPKAIEAYEILKLRYPEKAAHYDQKIQSLRQI